MEEQRLTFKDRNHYSRGPWDDEPDRIYWIDDETKYPCLMKRNNSGVWCGYVAVNESHPLYGQDYSEQDIKIHGGLTYAGPCDGDTEKGICHVKNDNEGEVYWFGFDCNHGNDLCPLYERYNISGGIFGIYRDEEYVKKEVKYLAKQLKNKESKNDESN